MCYYFGFYCGSRIDCYFLWCLLFCGVVGLLRDLLFWIDGGVLICNVAVNITLGVIVGLWQVRLMVGDGCGCCVVLFAICL